MIRDYTDMMHMTPNDLAQYARENANGSDLIQALADLLDAVTEECNGWEDRASELTVQVQELEDARDEWQGIAEQLNGVVKELHRGQMILPIGRPMSPAWTTRTCFGSSRR